MTAVAGRSTLRRDLGVVGLDGAADGLFYTSLSLVAVASGGATSAAAVMTAGTLARAVTVLAGGSIGDQRGLKTMGQFTFICRILVLLAGVAAYSSGSFWSLAALAVAVGALDGLNAPAIMGLGGLIAQEGEQRFVRGRAQATARISSSAGAVLAGLLLGWRVDSSLIVAAVLLAVGTPLLRVVRLPGGEDPGQGGGGPGLRHDIAQTLAWAVRDRLVLTTLTTTAAVNIATTAPILLGLPLLAERDAWPAWAFGIAAGSLSVGLAIGGWGADWIHEHISQRPLVLLAVVPVMLAVLSIGLGPAIASAAVGVIGISVGSSGAELIGSVAEKLSDAEQGRWQSLITLTATLSVPLGHQLYGLMASSSLELAGLVMAFFLAVALGGVGLSRR